MDCERPETVERVHRDIVELVRQAVRDVDIADVLSHKVNALELQHVKWKQVLLKYLSDGCAHSSVVWVT